MQAEDTSQKDELTTTTHRGSTMMSSRVLEGGREPMKQKEGLTMKKLSQNTFTERIACINFQELVHFKQI